MELFTLLISILVLLICYIWWGTVQERRKYPDGPTPLPIIGNLHQVAMAGGNIITFLEQNRKKYGNIFSMTMGGYTRVVISGRENVQNLLVKSADVTSNRDGRVLSAAIRELMKDKATGVFWSSYPTWKHLRTFSLNALRDEGMGKNILEPSILEEFQAFCEKFIEPNLGEPIDLCEGFGLATSNIISSMVFGSRFDYDDKLFNDLVQAIQEMAASGVRTALTLNMPWLKYLPGNLDGNKITRKLSLEILRPAIARFVEEHRQNLDPDNPRDLIDKYLIMIEQEKNKEESCFTVAQLRTVVTQLYIAGTDTTAKALVWAFLYMCRRIDIQEQVRKEISEQIGFDRLPSYKDRLNMPFTDAVITEILRIGNVVPTALPHTLDREMIVEGKMIPAGSQLMMNMASCLNDEDIFPGPEEFNPDRFMGEGAENKTKSIPFGIGRRMCLGESLARTELFLFFTSLLQKYHVCGADDDKLSTSAVPGITNGPVPYQVVFSHINPL